MDIDEEAVRTISAAIKQGFNIQKDKLKFDKTYQALVTGVVDSNHYKVKIHGQEYPCVPYSNPIGCAKGESVWVTVPQGNWNQMFITGIRIN